MCHGRSVAAEVNGVMNLDPKKLYSATVTCPVCNRPFPVTKVRVGSYRIADRDSDFAINFEGVNPIFYEVFVCENCGYAALQDCFANIGPAGQKIIAATVTPYWRPKSYGGERTLDGALDTYKLALYCLQLLKAKASAIAQICMRIAWLYRWKGDPREMEFLRFALDYYSDAYQFENFPIKNLDEPHCLYLIAELHRRVGNLVEAARWFNKLFSSPAARQDRLLWNLAYDQYQLIKDLRRGS
ncbi:MAG: DUF2225 domain-containing protein [Bacillota bacterium]|jgi:uncharacterized protein (DUF2225 family)